MTGEQDTVNPAQLSLTEWLPLAERAKLGCLPDALHVEQIATLEYPDNQTMRVAYARHLQAECDAGKLPWFSSQYSDVWIEDPEGLTWWYKRLELCEGPTPTIRRADYRDWLIRQGKSLPAWWFPTTPLPQSAAIAQARTELGKRIPVTPLDDAATINCKIQQDENDGKIQPLGRRERQFEKAVFEIKQRGWNLIDIPLGGIAELKKACCDNYPKLFTVSGFDHFWRWVKKNKILK